MRITSINNTNFKRQLRPDEMVDFSQVAQQAKKKLGNTGHSILVLPSSSLPQAVNTGVGNFLDKSGEDFINFAKQYWDINYIQLLPEGHHKHLEGTFFPYSGSALDLGPQLINYELLTTKEYGKILAHQDIDILVGANARNKKFSGVNFENILGKYSEGEKTLRKAFHELLKADNPEKKDLLNKIDIYAEKNKDWLEPKSIFNALSAKNKTSDTRNWKSVEHNLYNLDIVSVKERNNIINQLKTDLHNEIKFFEFKQYLAETHLAKAKEQLNKKGIKLSGDVLVGFSFDEIWANPKAFIKDASIGWGLPALDFNTPEGEKLLRKKINLFAQRYDGIRIDASWTYSNQPVEILSTKKNFKRDYGSKILDIIDDEFFKVKGYDYGSENIMHEFLAKLEDFDIYENGKIKPFVDKRIKINSSNGMHSDWGSTSNFKARGWSKDHYILGTTNHDCLPMRKQFAPPAAREEQTKVLSRLLKIPENKLKTLEEFIQAKFAEPMRAKHNMMFFTEALNIDGQYKDNIASFKDYRLNIPNNYKTEYFSALEKNKGFNIMDALEKAFIAEGLDKKEPELFRKINKYKKILKTPEKKFGSKKIIIIGLIGIKLALASIYLIHKQNKKKAGKADSNAQNSTNI